MYYLYILRSIDNNLYIGQTDNLEKRLFEHQNHLYSGAKFTIEHDNFKLVYVEEYSSRLESMRREKQLKGWTRVKKEALIEGNFGLLKNL